MSRTSPRTRTFTGSVFTTCPLTSCIPGSAYQHDRTIINLPPGKYNVYIAADNVTSGESTNEAAPTVVELP